MSRTSNSHTITVTSAGASPLAQAFSAMSTNTWANFTMGGLNFNLVDAGGSHSIVEFCAKGLWDAGHKKMQFWGQGHLTGEKLITYDDASNQWSVPYSSGFLGEGHAYYHLAMKPSTGDLYLRTYNSGTIRRRIYGANWDTATSFTNENNQVAGALEWSTEVNSGAGGLVFCDVGGAKISNASVSSWGSQVNAPSGNYHNWSAVANGLVYFGGGNGSSAFYRMNAAGTVTNLGSTPLQAGIWSAGGSAGVLAHPNGTDLLLFGPGSTGAVHRYNGSSWSSLGSGAMNADRWFAVSVSDYGGVVFICQTSSVNPPFCRLYKA